MMEFSLYIFLYMEDSHEIWYTCHLGRYAAYFIFPENPKFESFYL